MKTKSINYAIIYVKIKYYKSKMININYFNRFYDFISLQMTIPNI